MLLGGAGQASAMTLVDTIGTDPFNPAAFGSYNGGSEFAWALPEAIVGGQEAVTPLPSSWIMMLTGLGAMGLLGWRRKRKAAVIAA